MVVKIKAKKTVSAKNKTKKAMNSSRKMHKSTVRSGKKVKAHINRAAKVMAKKRQIAARRKARVHVIHKRVTVTVRPIIRKEIMMPEPWSKVAKFKKVKKENDWGYGTSY